MLLSSIGLMSSTAVLLLLQHEVCEVAQTWPELVQAWNAENLYVWMGVCFGRERERERGVFDLFWIFFLIKNVLE